MGIRIRRKLGYGLTDVQYDKEGWKFSDPRINASSFLLDYETDKPDMADYREWLETNAEDTFVEGWYFSDLDEEKCRRCRPEDRLDELVTHDPEFGEPGVLLIRPLGYRDWQRYDDSIDYYDANMGVGAEPCVKLIDGGLYPFMGGYVDVRSGEKLGDKIMWWVRAKNGGNVDPTKLRHPRADVRLSRPCGGAGVRPSRGSRTDCEPVSVWAALHLGRSHPATSAHALHVLELTRARHFWTTSKSTRKGFRSFSESISSHTLKRRGSGTIRTKLLRPDPLRKSIRSNHCS